MAKTSYRTRNTRSKRNRYIRSSRSSKAQSKQLLMVSNKVANLSREIRMKRQWRQFAMENVFTDGGNTEPQELPYKFRVIPLTRPDNWQPCFQSNLGTGINQISNQFGNRFIGRSMRLSMRFEVTNKELRCPPTTVQMWVVSLKNETGLRCLQETNQLETTEGGLGDFNDGSISNNRYWIDTTIRGGTAPASMVMLNKDVFKIHYFKQFTMGNTLVGDVLEEAQPTTQMKSVIRKYYTKLPYLNHIRVGSNTPADATSSRRSGWRDLEIEDLQPNDRRYIIIHTHYEYTPTFEVYSGLSFSYNCLFNGQTVGGN